MYVFLVCGMNHHLSDISLVVWEVNTDGKTEVLVTVVSITWRQVSITWRQNLWEGIPTTWVVKYSPLCLIAMDEPGQDQWAESAINKKEGGEDRRECKDKSVVRSATPRKETKWRSCDHLEQFPFHNFRYQVIFHKQGIGEALKRLWCWNVSPLAPGNPAEPCAPEHLKAMEEDFDPENCLYLSFYQRLQ